MATYYVATTGNDANNGTSPALARLTISGGVALLASGDTLIVGAGTYDDNIYDNVPSGGDWSTPTRIQAAAGTTVWMAPRGGTYVIAFDQNQQYIEFTGINLDATRGVSTGCVYLRGWASGNPHHIRFQNAEVIGPTNGVINEGFSAFAAFQCTSEIAGLTGSCEYLNLTIHGCGDAGDFSPGIYVATSDNLISNNNVYDASYAGIIDSNSLTTNNNIIRNNVVHDLSRTVSGGDFLVGIFIGPGTAKQVYNNVVYNITGLNEGTNAGISVNQGVSTLVYQNTVTNNTGLYGIHTFPGATSGTIVENNILYANSPLNLVDDGGPSTLTTNLIGINPVFVNPSGNNFQLTVGSPAIDAGTTNAYTTDILGVTRPQGSAFDIGAYEFVAAPPQNDLWAASVM